MRATSGAAYRALGPAAACAIAGLCAVCGPAAARAQGDDAARRAQVHRARAEACAAADDRRCAAYELLAVLRLAPEPAAAQRYDALGYDVFGRRYDFAPDSPEADDFAAWERSGLALSLGLGSQYAGLGGQVGYEWNPVPTRFTLAPYAALGAVPARMSAALPGFSVGVMGMYGGRWRWVADVGLGALGAVRFELFGNPAAERVVYAARIELGQQWTQRDGLFVRWLLGATLGVDPHASSELGPAFSLALGFKP